MANIIFERIIEDKLGVEPNWIDCINRIEHRGTTYYECAVYLEGGQHKCVTIAIDVEVKSIDEEFDDIFGEIK